MKPRLVDVHTHTQFAAFLKDGDEVIRRALDAEIWIVNVGTQKNTSKSAVDLSHKYEGVFATIGLHPIHTEKSFHDEQELGVILKKDEKEEGLSISDFSNREDFDHDYYKNLAADHKVVAIGECGLDYFHLSGDSKEKQAETFIKQIKLANEIGKPLMIHCREAFGDLISILKKNLVIAPYISPGVIHFFSGTTDDAAQLMDLGFSFSFGGVLTFARAYEKLIRFIPLDRILLETDAPYVAPQAFRGKRNEPLYVEEVAKKIARILEKDFEEIASQTTENAAIILGLKI